MTATTVRIRRGEPADLDVLEELERVSFDDAWNRASLSRLLHDLNALVLVAVGEADAVRGYASFARLAGEAELLRLAVVPSARRQGTAALLVRRGLEQLGHESIHRVFLEVRPDNRAAIELYRRLDFEQVARRPAYYRDGTEALVLARTLGGKGGKS